MLIVIETNVIISAALSPDGVPAKLLAKALTHHQLVITSATFAELESRLWKPRFDRYFYREERKAVLHDISAAAIWVEVPQDVADARYCRDADDDMFIHSCCNCSRGKAVDHVGIRISCCWQKALMIIILCLYPSLQQH